MSEYPPPEDGRDMHVARQREERTIATAQINAQANAIERLAGARLKLAAAMREEAAALDQLEAAEARAETRAVRKPPKTALQNGNGPAPRPRSASTRAV